LSARNAQETGARAAALSARSAQETGAASVFVHCSAPTSICQ
jgi:hypothetical protein